MTIRFYGPRSEYGFLSNFYPSKIQIDSMFAPTVEHYYQAMKTLVPEERNEILTAQTPREAKNLGRKCLLREDWDTVVGTPALHDIFRDSLGIVVESTKDHLMYEALIAKFTQHPDLQAALIQTGSVDLIEDAPRDFYWGAGHDDSGLNKLGRMLMLVRKALPK